ncbi:MAG TPA: hypothetical protein VNQ73_01150 [Ilumatobacter sp.]|nr:hypothetical protein [Ilumatobacter sp.]
MGVLVTVGFALAAVLWHLSSTERVAVLAVAVPVERGATIAAGDLRVVYVQAGDEIAYLAAAETAAIVGKVAVVDLPAGVLWSPSFVTSGAVIGEGDGLAGLALDAGQFPVGLIGGDLVNVVTSAGAADAADPVVVRHAEVAAVDQARSDGRTLVSLRASVADAELIASLAGSGSSGGLRLVLVGQ